MNDELSKRIDKISFKFAVFNDQLRTSPKKIQLLNGKNLVSGAVKYIAVES